MGEELRQLDVRIDSQDKRIEQSAKQDERIQSLREVEGIGPVIASALIAAVDNATQFRTRRDMAARVELVPKQHSSSSKTRLGGISERGDPYFRTLLIQGVHSILRTSINKQDRRSKWACALAERSHKNIAAVAIANKNARIAWAILNKGEKYRGRQMGEYKSGKNKLAVKNRSKVP